MGKVCAIKWKSTVTAGIVHQLLRSVLLRNVCACLQMRVCVSYHKAPPPLPIICICFFFFFLSSPVTVAFPAITASFQE